MVRSLLAVTLAAASLSLASPLALGQAGGGSGRGGPTTGSAAGMTINFGGGTVRDFVAHLQEQTGEQQVVIKNDLAGNAVLPPIRLTNANMPTAMAALEVLVDLGSIDGFEVSNIGGAYIVEAFGSDDASGSLGGADFVFEGGSGVEFMSAIKKTFPDANVVARGAARQANIPPLRLSNIYLSGVLSSLDGMIIDASGSQPKLRLVVEDRRALFLIDAIEFSSPREEVQFRALSLAHIIGAGGVSEVDALSAIEAAIEVGGGADSTRIQFHEETSLLIISAPPGVIGIVTQVVNTLSDASVDARDKREQRSQLESEITVAHSRLEYFSEVLSIAEQRSERATAAFEAGQISESQVHEHRLQALEARAEVKEAEARLMQLERRLRAYE